MELKALRVKSIKQSHIISKFQDKTSLNEGLFLNTAVCFQFLSPLFTFVCQSFHNVFPFAFCSHSTPIKALGDMRDNKEMLTIV